MARRRVLALAGLTALGCLLSTGSTAAQSGPTARHTFTNHHIFCWPIDTETVPVAPSFQTKIIIITINITIFNQGPGGGIHINPVGTGAAAIFIIANHNTINC